MCVLYSSGQSTPWGGSQGSSRSGALEDDRELGVVKTLRAKRGMLLQKNFKIQDVSGAFWSGFGMN